MLATTTLWKPTFAHTRWDPELSTEHRYFQDTVQDVSDAIASSGDLYRAEYAAQARSGSCYALADALACTLAAGGAFSNAILLESGHSRNIALGTTDLYYLDAYGGDTCETEQRPYGDASEEYLASLKEAHRKFLQGAKAGAAACYFWREDQSVRSEPVEVIADFDTVEPALAPNLHIVVTAVEGVAMLHRIGDLNRYSSDEYVFKNGWEKFEQAEVELKDSIPVFVNIAGPKPSLVSA